MFSCSQPPASPSTQEAIQGMLSMANLQSSDSCLQASWGTNQAKNNSISTQNSKKTGGGSNKNAGKRLLKKSTKNSIDIEDYDEDQDHLDACFKDSDYGTYTRSSLSYVCAWVCVCIFTNTPRVSHGTLFQFHVVCYTEISKF